MSESTFVTDKKPCPLCRANGADKRGDNLIIYSDGSTFCFACDKANIKATKFVKGKVQELKARCISEDTCRKFNVQVGKFTGWMDIRNGVDIGQQVGMQKVENHWVKVFNWYENNTCIAQFIKDENKNTRFIGAAKGIGLYGMWLWEPSDKLFIVITGGLEDALAVAEAQGLIYPTVSLPNGDMSVKKAVEKDYKKLLGFKHIVYWPDSEAGEKQKADVQKSIDYLLSVFEPGKVRIVNCPDYKDANAILMNQSLSLDKRYSLIKSYVWNAKDPGLSTIATMSDLLEDVLVRPKRGEDYAWPALTDITYGRQGSEFFVWVAATGIGKTELILKLLIPFASTNNIGIFSFEQEASNTARRIVGNILGKRLHIPGEDWDEDLIKETAMQYDNKIYFYRKPGQIDLDELFKNIRYMAKVFNCKIFVIDNLKALNLYDLERAQHFMNVIQSMKLELGIDIHCLSHVCKDKYQLQTYVSTSPKRQEEYMAMKVEDIEELVKKPGLSWETGREPNIENIDGHGIIAQLADYVFVLSRYTTSKDDDERRTIKITGKKTRLDSSKTGKSFKLRYTSTGAYEQVDGSYKSDSNKEEPF